MIADEPLKAIQNYIDILLQSTDDVFLVEVKIETGNAISVFLDADSGVTIEKCVQVNRALYKYIEENELFKDGNFALEVSSAGVDEPLKLLRQYAKNAGRTVEVNLLDDSIKTGKLLGVNDEGITIMETNNKNKKRVPHPAAESGQGSGTPAKETNILFNQIRHTKVLVTF